MPNTIKTIIFIILLFIVVFTINYKIITELISYHLVYDDSHSYLRQTNIENKPLSDPLGQEPRLFGSIPQEYNKAKISISTTSIIKHIQLTLLLTDYYEGSINGTLDESTIKSIREYQKVHNLQIIKNNYLDKMTLNSLGVILND